MSFQSSRMFESKDTTTNVRPAFFYTKAFVYNSVAICLIMTKLSYRTV